MANQLPESTNRCRSSRPLGRWIPGRLTPESVVEFGFRSTGHDEIETVLQPPVSSSVRISGLPTGGPFRLQDRQAWGRCFIHRERPVSINRRE